MRVAVVGAGIIGVTTAYELGVEGCDVTVFERRGAVAEETSFANAGLVAPGYVTPWAAPGMPMNSPGMGEMKKGTLTIYAVPKNRREPYIFSVE